MAYLCIFLALFQNIQSTCSGNLPEPLKLRISPLNPRIAQHRVPSQQSLLTLHNFLGSLHIRPICLTWNNGTSAPDMPCCYGPWLTISSPVMQNPSICRNPPSLCHHIGFTLCIRNALVGPPTTHCYSLNKLLL